MPAILISRFVALPDLHQNPRYAKAMADIGWTAQGLPGSYLYVRKLGPIGVAKIQRPQHIDLPLLKTLRKSHHLLTTYVEPGLHDEGLGKVGLSVEPFANSATSLVDLLPDKQSILDSFKQKTRYNIGLASRKHKLTIVTKLFEDLTKEDLAIFKSSRDAWSKRKGVIGYEENFIQALLKHFGNAGWLHFAYQGDICVGSLMILQNGKAAIYYAAFANTLGYSLFAPTLLTWTAMTTAKTAGCTIFDFGGIYDPRYKKMYKKWQGFTKFKEGFSPTIVTYPPTQLLLGW
jgi:lipid II:glycine glycyltransferase (peptidoglycan interpeptide bridge formation enzyme)